MAGYCTLVLYFHSPVARENTAAHSCNIQPYYLLTYQIIYIYIYIYIVRILYIHSVVFVSDVMVHIATLAQETRLAGLFVQ